MGHELDAVTHSEWRLLWVLGDMPDQTASPVFVAAHVPLAFLLLWLSHHSSDVVRERTRLGVSAFLVLHAVLHFINRASPDYGFHGVLSNTCIVGAALCGLAYVGASWREGFGPGPSPPPPAP